LLDAIAESADAARTIESFKPPAAARVAWDEFASLYRKLHAADSTWPDELQLVAQWYAPQLRRLHDDAAVREANLAQLAQMANGYPSRERFLTELTLDPPQASSDESAEPNRDEDYLILSTLHSAKGQEWQAVFILNVVDGCIPSDMATGHAAEIDEERRLLYVGMTRAKHHLHLLVPQRFYVTQQDPLGDRHLYGSLSRFIPPPLHPLFERIRPRAECAADGGSMASEQMNAQTSAPTVSVDLSARVRSLWA